ncbi:L,D-transpeptidase family protein [Amphritea sp.]|uniref:L,D-transpeptidase family protein n=1 Tax=Amphritea sp. TaxID=1872502 RepID=UPI003D14647C
MHIRISINRQSLELWRGSVCLTTYPVSTALNGAGEQKNSGCTPRGRHLIRAKIGAGKPLNTVFRGRRDSGEIYSAELAERYPQRDWILTRILWLSGCEIGRNRLSSVDTMQRYIYIHGTPDSEPMGQPLSHGCIRMRNADVADLFERVSVGTPVFIE